MLAKEVKRIIRSVFEPACRDHGFRRTKRGGIGWYHPYGGWYAGGSYLIRESDQHYRLKEVNGRWEPGKPKLVAPRTFVVSPFPEDAGKVIYFGGFDCNSGAVTCGNLP